MILRPVAVAAASLLALACGPGSKAGTTTTTTTTGNTGGAAAIYPAPKDHALFAPGTSWTFATVTTDSHYDDQDPAADASGNVNTSTAGQVTCTVAEVKPIAAGVMSRIECDGELSVGTVDPLSGWWAATDAGLWRVTEGAMTGAEPTLDPAAMFLGAMPAAASKETVLDEEIGHRETVTVSQEGAAWCVEESFMGGDGAWWSLCLDAAGPSRGSGGWSGGAEQEVTFTRAAP